MPRKFVLSYKTSGKRYKISDLTPESTYGDLLAKVKNTAFKNKSQTPLIAGLQGPFTDVNKKLREYGYNQIRQYRITVGVNAPGGTSNTFPSWASTQSKTCIIYHDTYPCVKLECGCWISFEGLRNFVMSKINENDVLICKGCDNLLSQIDDILQLCSFNEDKEDEYYDKLTKKHRIYIKNSGETADLGDAECPHCQTMNRRQTVKEYKMQCGNCSKYYCYECEETWKKSGKVICGNKDCNTMGIQEDLLNCAPIKSDNGRSWVDFLNKKHSLTGKAQIPVYRACIGCWNISTVVSNCRHTTCLECKMYYCFACLKPMQGHSDSKCNETKPAPRQILN